MAKKAFKFIKSLQLKKYRVEEQSFLTEGAKSVLELLHSDYHVKLLLATKAFVQDNFKILKEKMIDVVEAKQEEIEALGSFKTNNAALAVAGMKENSPLFLSEDEFALVLDDVRDPGNLGTILRVADWYGISKVICSETCADFYNPKVVSASMGSFTRVNAFYTHLADYLQDQKHGVYGAFLDGENVHKVDFPSSGYIVMGNESKGISDEVAKLVDFRVKIPRFGKAESLNVGIATAVICDNLRR